MPICTECGVAAYSDDNFCAHCGARIQRLDSSPSNSQPKPRVPLLPLSKSLPSSPCETRRITSPSPRPVPKYFNPGPPKLIMRIKANKTIRSNSSPSPSPKRPVQSRPKNNFLSLRNLPRSTREDNSFPSSPMTSRHVRPNGGFGPSSGYTAPIQRNPRQQNINPVEGNDEAGATVQSRRVSPRSPLMASTLQRAPQLVQSEKTSQELGLKIAEQSYIPRLALAGEFDQPPSSDPPPPPTGRRETRVQRIGWFLDPPRKDSQAQILVPLKSSSGDIIVKTGDSETLPGSEKEVVLVKSTFNAEISTPPLSRSPQPTLSIPAEANDKRFSFQTVVAKATGHSENKVYRAEIIGVEERPKKLGSRKTVMMFKIEVKQTSKSWTVYRRYEQFGKLNKKMKSKRIVNKSGAKLPGKKSDYNQLAQLLNGYLSDMLAKPQVVTCPYIHNFLEPLQLGDVKPM